MVLRRNREKAKFVMHFVQAPRIIKTFTGGHGESNGIPGRDGPRILLHSQEPKAELLRSVCRRA